MTNYIQAKEYLKNKTDRPLPGKATRLQTRPDGGIAVRYHNTDVVTYYPDRIVITHGGWQSRTTAMRVQEYVPTLIVFRRNWEWFICLAGDWSKAIPFSNHLVYQDGKLSNQ